MAKEFDGKVGFVVENYGDSALAKRFGVTRYPAIFIDEVLVATPKDFGWYGKGEGEGGGRYAPLKSASSHERFRTDLRKMIELILAGRTDQARAVAPAGEASEPASLPTLALKALDGAILTPETLAGKVVAVEIWATWCPPCRASLTRLGELRKRLGEKLVVVPVAIESDEANVRKLASELALPFHWTMGTPELVRALGDVSAVPTLLLFDHKGRAAGSYFGAPPGLHEEVEAKVRTLLEAAS